VSIANLLGSENLMQIEHIIPYSISLDDSFGNKTLCEANFNRDKGELTPYQYYLKNPDPKIWGIAKYTEVEDGWSEIETRAFKLLPYPKAKRFTSKKEFSAESFIERQLNDTRYISKKAVEILSAVCDDVRVLPGQLTAELRHLWGLNNVLQPIENINGLETNDFDTENSQACYVITDENGHAQSIHKVRNVRPETRSDEILLPGNITKEVFASRYLSVSFDAPEYENGKYWASLRLSEPLKLVPVFTPRPQTDENQIVFRGRVEKNKFSNDTLGRKMNTEAADGWYWACFQVINKSFEKPEKQKQPKASGNKVVLYGKVKEGVFYSYIYTCRSNMPEGNYWAILELNLEQVNYTHSINPKPEIGNEQLLISGTIDQNQWFAAEPDQNYRFRSSEKPGKYHVVFNILSQKSEYFKLENEAPKVPKDCKLIEGHIWVDKYTGDIKFDPKKNRDDHRHHAIDAITIALTEQAYLQYLSTYNAQRKSKERGLDSTEKFPLPWIGFDDEVKKVARSILISHKKSNKVLSKISKLVVKNGKRFQSIGFAARGQLHKESVFGSRQAPGQQESFHIRKALTDLKNNKHIDKVVDPVIRTLILNHLRDKCGVDISKSSFDVPKDAFFKDGRPLLFLPNKRGEPVPIKKIRIKENIGNAVPLKGFLNQWVNPRNNHHVLIYKDHDGNLKEEVVSFWVVVERQSKNQAIYQLPADGKEIISLLEINDMFLLGLSDEEFESNKENYPFLSRYLYRVQKLSSSFYTFRHHLASTVINSEEEYAIWSFNGWERANPIKVKSNILGQLEKI
jgi:CRISPR-associated endonuclease Csn1